MGKNKFFGSGEGYLGIKKKNNDLFIIYSTLCLIGIIIGFIYNYIFSLITLLIYFIAAEFLVASDEKNERQNNNNIYKG